MAEDLEVFVNKNKKNGFDLEINDEHGTPIILYERANVHAIDSFADFCRRYLVCYEKATSIENEVM